MASLAAAAAEGSGSKTADLARLVQLADDLDQALRPLWALRAAVADLLRCARCGAASGRRRSLFIHKL